MSVKSQTLQSARERRLQLFNEVEQLQATGNWNYTAYKRILSEALHTVEDLTPSQQGDALAFLWMAAEPEWLEFETHA